MKTEHFGLRPLFSVDPDMYRNISEGVAEDNRKCLRVFSAIAFFPFLLLTVFSLFTASIHANFWIYVCYTLLCLIFHGISWCLPLKPRQVQVMVYLFVFFSLVFGVLLGTVCAPNELSVSFVALVFAVPLMFIGRPTVLNSIITAGIMLYIGIGMYTQTPEMLRYNLISILPYSAVSMLVSSFVMNIKIQRIHYRRENSVLEAHDREFALRRQNFDSFINEMIRNAAKVSDPNQAINELLEYIGENLKTDRAYIFEENAEGTYDNTYEWCRKGVPSQKDQLQQLPCQGLLDSWFQEFSRSKNVVIRDPEEYRPVSEPIYELLKEQQVHSLVAGPIMVDGRVIGFYGVDNPPKETIERISELIDLMEFAFTMMIRFRNGNREIQSGAVHDFLTGCKNRHAMKWAYEEKALQNRPVALIMCDLNGLKNVNDLQGHLAGDRFILHLSDTLKGIFGEERVYRIGGDEFVVILVDEETRDLETKLEAARLTIGGTASIGVEYRERMDLSFDDLLKAADEKMYEEKKRFYAEKGSRKCY